MTISPGNPTLVQIFIGEPIQHRSDYDCLSEVYSILIQKGQWAYVFANFHLADRQVDLLVFTEKTTAIIEAKNYSFPVRGGTNGPWEQYGPNGKRKIRNAYEQAWNARNTLRDEITRRYKIDGYPNGLVIITPEIPKGSDLSTNHKVVIKGLSQVGPELARPSGAHLTQDQCTSFAKTLRLERVEHIEAALDSQVLIAERTHQAYAEAFRAFHTPLAEALLEDKYTFDKAKIGRDKVQSLVLSGDHGVFIKGPSGCGKSMLATYCAIACLGADFIPVFVNGGNFEGNFQRLLDKEAALLGLRSASCITKMARTLGRRLILFLDGYNECPESLQLNLTRSIRAFSLRYGASIVISTQQDISRCDLLEAHSVFVHRPSDALKASLAKVSKPDPTGNLHSLLQVTTSGLEASLAGQVGTTLPAGSSRFGLFDCYARIKLGIAASEGIRLLTSIAEKLVFETCFSLSVREFDRLCDGANLVHLNGSQLIRSKLLHVRGDRVSFVHELFFAAFSAEAVIRSANGNAQKIIAALDSPRFFSAKVFILGAVENNQVLQEVLSNLNDQDLLSACFQGECGATAQSVTKRKITSVLDAMLSEAKTLDFHFIGEGWDSVEINPTSLNSELKNFDSYIGAIGEGLMRGQYLNVVLSACRYVDNAIANFTANNEAEAKTRKAPLRHNLFSEAYVMHRGAAISQLVKFIHSGGISFRRKEGGDFQPAILDAWKCAQSPGQQYLLIGLTRFTSHELETAPYVATLLRNVRTQPYHLQLALIDFAHYFREAKEPYRTIIIESLQAALDKLGVMMNTIIFDALRSLGALDEDEQNYAPIVCAEIQNALDSEGSESDSVAWGLFSCQFDHPFDAVYWDEIQSLDEPRKKHFFTKACRGASGNFVSFLGILIRQLSEFNDQTVAPAITKWTALPEKSSFMPQDAVEVFVIAHEALGRLDALLPPSRGHATNEADSALLACGELFYWANRANVEDAEISINTLVARSTLLESCRNSAAGALKLTTSRFLSSDGTRTSLVKKYPLTSAQICRDALENPIQQVSYFEHSFDCDPDSITRFSIQVLGEVGNIDDLAMLRDLCDNKNCGTEALIAIKRIEERHRFRSSSV